MFEFYQLEQLIMIAKMGSITKAAKELHITQPALSNSIHSLENQLGLTLFERKKHGIELNDHGHIVVTLASNLLFQKNNMVQSLHAFNRSKHTISIGSCAPAPVWVITEVCEQLYPHMKIVSQLDSQENNILQGLENYEYSIVILTQPIHDDQYECIELFDEYLHLSVPKDHPLASYTNISWSDLDGESVLLLSSIGLWHEICLRKLPHSYLIMQEDNQVFGELTRVSTLPYFGSNIVTLNEDKERNRVTIPITDSDAHMKYYMTYHKTNPSQFHELNNKIKTIHW